MLLLLQFQGQNKIDASIGFSTTQSVQNGRLVHLFLKKKSIEFFEHRIIYFSKKKQLYEFLKKILPLNRSVETVLDTHFIPLQNEPSPILVSPKLGEEKAFECRRTSLFRRAVFIQIDKLIITHQEPTEGIQVLLLLGYPSNIPGYPSKYCNYTSKRKLGRLPHFPVPPSPSG